MRIVCISDTHREHPDLPHGDLLIHAGDLTSLGKIEEVITELSWLQSQLSNFPLGVLFVPGNHDSLFQHQPDLAKQLCSERSVRLLMDEEVIINGVKFYGSPYTPVFGAWSFMKYRDELEEHWKKVPEDTQVLISHGPPYGLGDITSRAGHVGDEALAKRLDELSNIRLNVFGHIHEGYGVYWKNNRCFVNASVLDAWYSGFNAPIMLDLNYPDINVILYEFKESV